MCGAENSDDKWKKILTPDQYEIARNKGTEYAFTGIYWDKKDPGVYTCVCCGVELFSSKTKYDSGSGWPSFYEALGSDGSNDSTSNIVRHEDRSTGYLRTEISCKQCDAHLGHVFEDGPKPTGLRYCVNSASLNFQSGDPK